jgi:hypothetical protein
LPAKKTARDILVGFRDDLFEIISFLAKYFCVYAILKNKIDNFIYQSVMVYGSPYHEHKLEFIAELHDVMENSTIPTLICGDFNLVRCAKEKSSERIDPQMTFLFNDWINKWMLMEFKPSNRLYS